MVTEVLEEIVLFVDAHILQNKYNAISDEWFMLLLLSNPDFFGNETAVLRSKSMSWFRKTYSGNYGLRLATKDNINTIHLIFKNQEDAIAWQMTHL